MCHALLSDPNFYRLLLGFDRDLARESVAGGCPCGGKLHSARYPRKPRGGPADLGAEYAWRLSYCCAREGCRRRTTPPSLRFLGQRVYLAAVVVLASAMEGGVTVKRAERLHELVGVSVRTLRRWRAWWRGAFRETAFWRKAQGNFAPAVDVSALPRSLLERFSGADEQARLIQALRFLAPLTIRSA